MTIEYFNDIVCPSLFITGDIEEFIPNDHTLKRVDHFLDGYINQREPITDVVFYASNV
jgi:hypothetical protein